ncbi:hypothetical protein [Mesorhizobium onobrychidis]|uniref:Uncharacterized protein n=1 Tax=Mesorhizobium onobrychidis TaxID=2775404 RepID=A0ABY5R7A9_9HYPH|nr:hypothetical protein [Mesorhizobium onobrychidis]UVC19433.1 hypothetical protein IHQ72_35910 [Mesorhizobium onobrychidis]
MSKAAPFNEAFSTEDAAYVGSRFAVTREALFANPYQEVWGKPGNLPIPTYAVTLGSVLKGILPFGLPYAFREASARAIDSSADLRWGPDRKGYRRLLHPNGICLTGIWNISAKTEYSGYFREGSRALTIARYSTCCTETKRGRARSLSMVGKLFSTLDREHTNPVRTASFITQQDIGGDWSDHINDAELLNAPNTTVWRRGLGTPVLVITGILFGIVDRKPSIRQLYPIAELGKPAGEPTRAPTFMRLRVDQQQPRIAGEDLDFRDEIMAQIYNAGDPAPKRTLTFDIEVTDDGETHGIAIRERRVFRNWRKIGTLAFDEAVASYNGDFVIHFPHPTWRDDKNDPATATRLNRKKVR